MEQGEENPYEPLLLSHFLANGRKDEVDVASRVTLPGLAVDSYSGYITVDEEHCGNLFFWFFPKNKDPQEKTPLLIYLNGGPGLSSLIGLFEEVGPIRVGDCEQLHLCETSWTEHYSMLFVDSPVGVGFSYSDIQDESMSNQHVADNLYSFLVQFLQLYPKYQKCDLYIGGMSYAGKYVPAFAHKVHTEMTEAKHSLHINLKGIYLGSGLFDPGAMLPLFPKFLVSLGMLTEHKGKEVTERIESAIAEVKCEGKSKEAIADLLGCIFDSMQSNMGYQGMDNALCTKDYDWKFEAYLNCPQTQRALHARRTEYAILRNDTVLQMADDFLMGIEMQLSLLLEHYKVLVFNGQMDMIVNVPMTESFLSGLTWRGRDEYMASDKLVWHDDDGEVAGYVNRVKNFTRVVIRKAGHRTAIDQPKWTKDMMFRFIHDKSFETEIM